MFAEDFKLGYKKILLSRPDFKGIEKCDNVLIDRWNMEVKKQADGIIVFGLGQIGKEITKYIENLDVYFIDVESDNLQVGKRNNNLLMKESIYALDYCNSNYLVNSGKGAVEELIENKILILCFSMEDYMERFGDIVLKISSLAKVKNVPVLGIVELNHFMEEKLVEIQLVEMLKTNLNICSIFKVRTCLEMNCCEYIEKINIETRIIINKMMLMLKTEIIEKPSVVFNKLEMYIVDNMLDAKTNFNNVKSYLTAKKSCNYECVMSICTNDSYKQEFYGNEIRKIWSGLFIYDRELWDSDKVGIIFIFYK